MERRKAEKYPESFWLEVRMEYVKGDMSIAAISETRGIPEKTLYARSVAEGWVEMRRNYRKKVLDRVMDKSTKSAADRYLKVLKIADKILDKIESSVDVLDEEQFLSGRGLFREVTSSLKTVKEIQDLKCEDDREEQRARIERLRKENSMAEAAGGYGVVLLPPIKSPESKDDE